MRDDVMARIVAAVERGRSGERTHARATLATLWEEVGGSTGDPFHRCVLAHFMADLQDDPHAELHWDQLALAAVADVTDERAQQYDKSLQVRTFLPSLYLSLADDHRRQGEMKKAHNYLNQAKSVIDALPDNPYGTTVKNAMAKITTALANGSTHPLTASET